MIKMDYARTCWQINITTNQSTNHFKPWHNRVVGILERTQLSSQRNKSYKSQCTSHRAPRVIQKPKLTEELKRRALNIPKQRSVCKSAMESGRSLMRGEPVSSRQCGRICVSIRKATDREQLHHPDTTNTSRRTCPHKPLCFYSLTF